MLVLPVLFSVSNLATTNPPAIVCTAGQCLQGYSNTSIGVTISAPSSSSALLLPGQYTSTTNPQLLHTLLTSSSASLASSPGFKNSTTTSGSGSGVALPLNVAQEPGLAIYNGPLYSGQAAFTAIPAAPVAVNAPSTPLALQSLTLPPNVWIAVSSTNSTQRVVIWDSVPDTSQLPPTAPSTFSLVQLESAACPAPCASSGICTAAGTCACAPGFTGASCETCAPGFFGAGCAACPAGCKTCDDGPTGSGRCLDSGSSSVAQCNCVNGACNADGSCACTAGFTTAGNGTQCAQCAAGFFQTAAGGCSVCQIGCTSCAATTGTCSACRAGFTPDANDATRCVAAPSVTSSGTTCPPGAFADGANCSPCAGACKTCTGGTAAECVLCAEGTYLVNVNGTSQCVGADANGVCAGTGGLIADNNKNECDSCGAKCTSCKIPNFSGASRVEELQCTGCVPGFFLSQGKCVESCPTGTFVAADKLTCTACDSSCTTCTGSSTFCLTCASNQLASSGKCVATCPSNTFSASGSCLPCHADCATCTGASFNQCTSCPAARPVPTNGRCLSTCPKSAFFDPTAAACIPCDASCSSCSGAGPGQCLACAGADSVLRAGTCVAAQCTHATRVVPGLGACLSELVAVPDPASADPALPSAPGIDAPTAAAAPRRALAWWEILLMALGCAFVFIGIVWLWRRRARAQRAQRTARFARTRQLDAVGWRWRLVRFGERLFGHRASRRAQAETQKKTISSPLPESEAVQMAKIRAAEEASDARDMDKLLANYDYPRAQHSHVHHHHHQHLSRDNVNGHGRNESVSTASTLAAPSLYPQVTGMPHRVPEPKEPLRSSSRDVTSRFSGSTIDEYYEPPTKAKKNPFWR
ncbi:TNFR/NGFR cysteine-rich region family protein [Mycena olivaceomarginata]|nr:TNFR/NGFR cysteine-rich region family protein [Mycena olivaceomarginata]